LTSREKSPEIVIFRIILIGRPPRVKSWDQKYFPFLLYGIPSTDAIVGRGPQIILRPSLSWATFNKDYKISGIHGEEKKRGMTTGLSQGTSLVQDQDKVS